MFEEVGLGIPYSPADSLPYYTCLPDCLPNSTLNYQLLIKGDLLIYMHLANILDMSTYLTLEKRPVIISCRPVKISLTYDTNDNLF